MTNEEIIEKGIEVGYTIGTMEYFETDSVIYVMNEARTDERNFILETDKAWSLPEVLAKLVEASEILMDEKDYDGHGHEQISACIARGKDILANLRKHPTPL